MEKELKRMCFIGYMLMIASVGFAVIETFHFGINHLPKSEAKLFCDSLCYTICGGGMSLFLYPIIIVTKKKIDELLLQLSELKKLWRKQ